MLSRYKINSQSILLNFRTGSLLATTCKDKKLRIIDPRSGEVLRVGDSHQGTKASKVSEILIHSWICNCAQWSPSFYDMAYISIDAWFMPIKHSTNVGLQLICVFQDTTQGPTTNMTYTLTTKVFESDALDNWCHYYSITQM